MKNKLQIGQVLIEALVALAAAVIIIGVIAVVVVTSLNNSELAKNQNLATQYAQQGIETVRELTETNWSVFSGLSDRWYCLYQDSTTINSSDSLDRSGRPASEANSCKWDNAIFTRRVYIERNANDCANSGNARVNVIVAWNDSKCLDSDNLYCHKVQVDSCFANIKSVPTI